MYYVLLHFYFPAFRHWSILKRPLSSKFFKPGITFGAKPDLIKPVVCKHSYDLTYENIFALACLLDYLIQASLSAEP